MCFGRSTRHIIEKKQRLHNLQYKKHEIEERTYLSGEKKWTNGEGEEKGAAG